MIVDVLCMTVCDKECACPWCGACQDPHGSLVCKNMSPKVFAQNMIFPKPM